MKYFPTRNAILANFLILRGFDVVVVENQWCFPLPQLGLLVVALLGPGGKILAASDSTGEVVS